MLSLNTTGTLLVGYAVIAAICFSLSQVRSRRRGSHVSIREQLVLIVVCCLWPLLFIAMAVAVVPDWWKNRKLRAAINAQKLAYERLLNTIESEPELSAAAVIESARSSFNELAEGAIFHHRAENFLAVLESALSPPAEEEVVLYSRAGVGDGGPMFSRAASEQTEHGDWHFGFSDAFAREVQRLDKNMQGRILMAITRLLEGPIQPHGDTIKPLSADLSGLWRYRIGDYRLIYLPETNRRRITLLTVAPRGDAYS